VVKAVERERARVRRRRFVWPVAALALVGGACKDRPADPPRETTAPPTIASPSGPSTSPPPAPASLVDRLQRHAVTDEDHARRIFYTWTSEQQIAALRADGASLLSATSYQGSGPSRFVLDLEDRIRAAARDHHIDRVVLMHPSLTRRRYAWPSPFATRMGLAGRGYGDALIRIELTDDAVIGRFEPEAAEPWSFVDTKGKIVDRAVVLADPDRLAAVFHVRRVRTATAPFREYVLVNERRIARWSIGTEAIAREVKEEAALMRELAGAWPDAPHAETWTAHWKKLPQPASLEATWSAAIAFDNDRYVPTAKNLNAIADALDAWAATPPAIERP
jgi:hypothetical protein